MIQIDIAPAKTMAERIPTVLNLHAWGPGRDEWVMLSHRLGDLLNGALADSRVPYRTEEVELAGHGVRWNEDQLDLELAMELRDQRAARNRRRG